MFHSPRLFEHSANDDTTLILDSIQLPSKMLLRSRSYVTNLYIKRYLPIREIARQMNVSHSTVSAWYIRILPNPTNTPCRNTCRRWCLSPGKGCHFLTAHIPNFVLLPLMTSPSFLPSVACCPHYRIEHNRRLSRFLYSVYGG